MMEQLTVSLDQHNYEPSVGPVWLDPQGPATPTHIHM